MHDLTPGHNRYRIPFTVFCVLFILLLLTLKQAKAQLTSAQIVWVDATNGDDSGDGTIQSQAVQTLVKGLALAKGYHAQNRAVVIRFRPGIYRGVLYWRSSTGASVTFDSEHTGTAVITGAESFTNWQQSGTLYTHTWTNDWGVTPIPKGWQLNGLNVSVPEIARRRELVIANGVLFRQVLTRAELQTGTFFVDEAANTLTVNASSPVTQAEVAMRPLVMDAQNSTNVTIKGLVFTGTAQHLDNAGAVLNNVQNLVLEDNVFQYNGAGGLGLSRSTGFSRRNQFLHNGSTGLGGVYNRDFVFDQDTACYNNLRGGWGGFFGWSVAGVKHLHQRNVQYRDLTTCHNQAAGLWLDSDMENVTVYRLKSHHNRMAGVYLEGLQGQIAVYDSIIEQNQSYGLLISSVHDLTLQGNWIVNNQEAGVFIGGTIPTRSVWNHVTDKYMSLFPAKNMTWERNHFGGLAHHTASALFYGTGQFNEAFRPTYKGDYNHWWNADGSRPFRVNNNNAVYYTVVLWQQLTGQDINSADRAATLTATATAQPIPKPTATMTATPTASATMTEFATPTAQIPTMTPEPVVTATQTKTPAVYWRFEIDVIIRGWCEGC